MAWVWLKTFLALNDEYFFLLVLKNPGRKDRSIDPPVARCVSFWIDQPKLFGPLAESRQRDQSCYRRRMRYLAARNLIRPAIRRNREHS